MRVLISALGAEMGGAMRHLTSFLPELGKIANDDEYVVLVRQSFPQLDLPPAIRLERVPNLQAASNFSRLRYDVIDIPRRVRAGNVDLVVSLTNFGPVWCPVPHVFFQRNPLYYCRCYLKRAPFRRRIDALLRRQLAVETMKRADLIVTPTNAMAEMIRDMCPQVAARRFHTLHHGFTRESLDEPLDQAIKARLPRSGLRLLYPTHLAWHKGFEVLFEMLALLRSGLPDFSLLATTWPAEWPEVFAPLERQLLRLGLERQVYFLGRVPQNQMGEIYRRADLMVYPSLCESFGFSMIEALGFGLPVVAAGTQVDREICGDAAIFYDPEDPAAGAAAVWEALKTSTRSRLLSRGDPASGWIRLGLGAVRAAVQGHGPLGQWAVANLSHVLTYGERRATAAGQAIARPGEINGLYDLSGGKKQTPGLELLKLGT